MDKIDSFTVDHTRLLPGIYVSRTDGDITTYDLRFKKPNTNDLLDNASMHSLEHMFASYIRNSSIKDTVIYFGPMGCQTGFYLLVRNAENQEVLEAVAGVLEKIINHKGEVFGYSETECGNYRNLSLEAAQNLSREYLNVLNSADRSFNYN